MTEINVLNNLAQEYEFEQPVVSIGSHAENDVVLAGDDVLPFHATAVLEGSQCRLIPMSPEAEIRVDDVVVWDESVSVEGFQQVEISAWVLFFQAGGETLRVLARPLGEKTASTQYISQDGESNILVNVITGEAAVDTEQTAFYELEVVNGGPIVAGFYVTVKGVPQEWVEISPDTINLNEGQRRHVEIQITPPRDYTSTAGTHPVEVIVHSPNYGGQRGYAELSLTINPFYEYTVGNLSPKNQRIRWRKRTGMTYLPVTNLSNTAADFNLMAMDDENGLAFDFCMDEDVQFTRQATTKLEAGQIEEVPIQITPIKNPMFAFKNKRYYFTTNVNIPQQAAAPQVLSGSAVGVPLFGWWSIVLTIAAFVIAAFFALQPNIRSFDVAAGKDVIELGDTTKLLWDVSPFATRLSISNVDDPITRGQFSETVAPEKSTTYELVSGNWLSGMFGLDQKEIVTVLVVPPTPQVNVFDVDETTIAKGKPINVRWSVKEADEAFLTIDEVVYPLTPEEFSGEREVILEKDALVTLEAVNASGSELQSYFVNVVPPYIDINTFTVWVRPDDGTVTADADDGSTASVDGAGKALMSKTTAPDPNFPVKFVELVADPNSETGYRVVFNSNVREELAKGEQVLLEWNVEGVESLQIAPFTEELPSHGSQPVFPQESMNFVMTAQSGELQGIFMLPIKVFDGEPPEAPKIEFFTASPSTMEGPGNSEFAWSVSGEWSRVQLSSGEDIIADYLNPQGFQTVSIDQTKNFLLTAWNGDLSSSEIIEVVVNPALLPVNVEITDVRDHSGFFYVGDTVNIFVELTDPELPDPNNPGQFLPPSPYPTGTITVSDGYQTCVVELPLKYCKDGFTFNAPGDPNNGYKKRIVASYSGDDIYLGGDSEPYAKQDIVVQANTVTLAPSFFEYFIAADGSGYVNPVEIKPLKDADLKVGEGLFIEVTVNATRGPLDVNDDKGQVIARYCPIDTATNEVQLDECTRTMPATVKVVGDPRLGVNIGLAELYIPNFQAAGHYQMLISYSHLDGAYESTLLEEENNKFTVKPGNVVLIPDGLAACNSSACEIAGRTNEALNFHAKLIVNNEEIPLYATYSQPENIPVEADSAPLQPTDEYIYFEAEDWTYPDQKCTWSATDRWRLECENVTLNNDGTINYHFEDANYQAGPQGISVNVKTVTEIIVDDGFAAGLFVGETINLQSKHVYVREYDKNPEMYPPSAEIIVTIEGVDDVNTILGVIPDGDGDPTNDCRVTGGRLIMPQSAAPSNDSCEVYFKHAGNYESRIVFNGDANYEKSNASSVFIVQQQQISIGWSTPVVPATTPPTYSPLVDDSQWEIYEYIPVRLNFDCNDNGSGTNCTDFEVSALSDARLEFDFNNTQDCDVYYPDENSKLTNGAMNLPVIPVGGVMEIDAKLRCKNMGPLTTNIEFVDPSHTDFLAFDDQGGEKRFEIIQKVVVLDPKVSIYTDSGKTIERVIADSASGTGVPGPLGNSIPSNNDDDANFWVDEEYVIYAEFAMPSDAQPTSDDRLIMGLPNDLYTAMKSDFDNCADGRVTVSGGVTSVPLDFEKEGNSWRAACDFSPDAEATLIDAAISFELSAASQVSATNVSIIQEADIAKRPLTIYNQIEGGQQVVSGDSTKYYAWTGPELQLEFYENHYQVDAITNWDTYLKVKWITAVSTSNLNCSKLPDGLVHCEIPDSKVVEADYRVRYEGNDTFEDNVFARIDLNIVEIPVELASVVGNFPEEAFCKWVNCSALGWPNGQEGNGQKLGFVGTNYIMTFTVRSEIPVSENVAGFVTVKFGNGWSNCKVDILDYNGEPSAEPTGETCTFKVPINSNNQQAVFKWKFKGIADDKRITYGYDNDNGVHPFTKGSTGWDSPPNFWIYEWIEFSLDPVLCGTVYNTCFKVKPDLPMRADGYTVYGEYSVSGASEEYFNCEGESSGNCWGHRKVFETSGGADDDGVVKTDPKWIDVSQNYYQIILLNETTNELGWVRKFP